MSEHSSSDDSSSSDGCGIDNSASSHFPRSRAALDDLFSALLDDSSSDEEPSFDEIFEEIIDIVKELQKIYEESFDALE